MSAKRVRGRKENEELSLIFNLLLKNTIDPLHQGGRWSFLPVRVVNNTNQICSTFRFEPVPEVGKNKGLKLVLDAHQDLLASSSVSEDFEVKHDFTYTTSCELNHHFLVVGFQCNN